ncbi:MAG TPA: YhfC family glutamic-type intramembrane protease [Oscillospiraceae bacterium]|nr:YhfC family glutamic-type intramembrane protease [Oscillospiraceae bacterium]HPF55709.1 YhfC family glutamic-type intramembrane protease [Clostridiales bacterium]HPK35546.1 YhfC family glutamic-type intramembrane protease [Oscillospiraceae bacterium]HPR75908.1 YhfC family glutamic-type intramembrane protease [Oscillospiraceae bacterium]
MDYTVPILSVISMGIASLFGIAIPLVLFLVLRKKYKADIMPFFIGCAVFIVFALLLEGGINLLIFSSSLGPAIKSNLWIYAAVAGLMAGIFEETGRFVAFNTVLHKKMGNDRNALMYGAGHGGVEVIYILYIGMVSNIVISLMLNAGYYDSLSAGITDEATLAALKSSLETLATTPPATFFVGVVERIAAVAAHLSFSVLVWFAVKRAKKFWLFPLAIVIHALLNFAAVLLASSGLNVWLVEGAIYMFTGLFVILAIIVWNKNAKKDEPAETQPAEALPS